MKVNTNNWDASEGGIVNFKKIIPNFTCFFLQQLKKSKNENEVVKMHSLQTPFSRI